jgi:hypothetical protein
MELPGERRPLAQTQLFSLACRRVKKRGKGERVFRNYPLPLRLKLANTFHI